MSTQFATVTATGSPAAGRRPWGPKRLGLRAKILSLVGLAVCALFVCLVPSANALTNLTRALGETTNSTVPFTITALDTRVAVESYQKAWLQLILVNTPEQTAAAVDGIATAAKAADSGLQRMSNHFQGDERDAARVKTVVAAWEAEKSFFETEVRPQALSSSLSREQTDALAGLVVSKGLARSADTSNALTELVTERTTDLATGNAELLDFAEKALTGSVAICVIGALALAAVGWWLAGAIVRPVHRVKDVMDALAAGDLTRTLAVDSDDEIGQMSSSLATAQMSMRETLSRIGSSADTLAASAEQLSVVAAQVAASAMETSAQSGTAAETADQVSRNVQTVAAATEQMSSSIREISQNSTQAVQVARSAAEEAHAANVTVAKLGDSSREIGDVVKVITSIAEQTNLLALNATIEAARAGEAGKGFAVVATEVKDLAQETARATEDIGRRIEAIQADTDDAIAAIGRISTVIEEVNSYQTTIASAVEEQTATTGEMARNVSEAANGAGGIAGSIEFVANAAQSSNAGMAEAQRSAGELAHLSGELRDLVRRFRV